MKFGYCKVIFFLSEANQETKHLCLGAHTNWFDGCVAAVSAQSHHLKRSPLLDYTCFKFYSLSLSNR